MGPRRHADPLVDALALPLPAGRVPLRASCVDENRAPRQGRAGVRAARHRRSSTTTASSTSTSTYAKAGARRPAACASRSRNARPGRRAAARAADAVVPQHLVVGRRRLAAAAASRGRRRAGCVAEHADARAGYVLVRRRAIAEALFCDNETNAERLFGRAPAHAVPEGRRSTTASSRRRGTVNPARRGTKAALGTGSSVAAGRARRVRLRLQPDRRRPDGAPFGDDFDSVCRAARARGRRVLRRARRPPTRTGGRGAHAPGARPGCSGRKQFYRYDVAPLARRRPRPAAAPAGALAGRNARGAPHAATSSRCPTSGSTRGSPRGTSPSTAVALAHVDPAFAKEQLCCCAASGPCTQRPAARLRVGVRRRQPAGARAGRPAGLRDRRRPRPRVPRRVFHKLLLNFTWWVNRKDADGQQPVRGRLPRPGQHRPLRPLEPLPVGGVLEQSDATAWMAMYCLDLLEIALELAASTTGLRGHRHQVLRALRADRAAHERPRRLVGRARTASTTTCSPRRTARQPLRVRSMVGLLPLLAATPSCGVDELPGFASRWSGSPTHRPGAPARRLARSPTADRRDAPAAARSSAPDRLRRVLARCSTRRSSCRRTASARSRARHREHPFRRASTADRRGRLRARRVDDRPVRRQLELARAGLVPGQLPAHRGARRSSTASSATSFTVECPTGSGD